MYVCATCTDGDQALYCSGFGVRDRSAAAASGTLVVPSITAATTSVMDQLSNDQRSELRELLGAMAAAESDPARREFLEGFSEGFGLVEDPALLHE
ncbi:hypothetical protein [Streptomyces mirabilis]|uniref:hypothetical protein n=1 Tax=Streptomyces mirabilis TaxID=68239 RepID=UPI0036BE003C